MEFFLDTASIEAIQSFQELGLVDGVTTNPALLAQEGQDPLRQLKEIAAMVSGPVSAQVIETDPERMIKHAQKLARVADNIVVKIPASSAGLLAAQALHAEGIKLLVTLNVHAAQTIPFIRMGVDYVAVFVGRLDAAELDSTSLTWDTRRAIDQLNSPTKLMAASLRTPDHLTNALAAGTHVATVSPTFWNQVFANPIFVSVEREFLQSWQQLPQELRRGYESWDDEETG